MTAPKPPALPELAEALNRCMGILKAVDPSMHFVIVVNACEEHGDRGRIGHISLRTQACCAGHLIALAAEACRNMALLDGTQRTAHVEMEH